MDLVIIDGLGYEVESKLLFAQMQTVPDQNRKRVINNFIKRLKSDGIWGLLDVMWIMASHSQQASRLNWKNPSIFTLTEVNGPTWTRDQGYTGNSTNMYLDTGWDASNNGINFTKNNSSFGAYSRTDSLASGVLMGADNASTQGNTINPNASATNRVNYRVNSASNVGTINQSNTQGFYYGYRTDSTNNTSGKNGSNIQTLAQASVALNTLDFYVLARNNNGTAASFTSAEISMAFIGSGSINFLLFFNAFESYMDELGKGVV